MKEKKVISTKSLPSRLPIFQTLLVWICLDYWHAPQWLWGALGLLFLFAWIFSIVGIAKETQVEIFKDGKP